MEPKKLSNIRIKKLRKKRADATSSKPKRSRKHTKRTEPEQLTQDLLVEMGIPFEIEKSLPFKRSWKHYDIALDDYPILIEIDGDYWHGNEEFIKESRSKRNLMQLKNKQNDYLKNWLAKSNGFKLLRIWESDIKNDIEGVRKKIQDIISECQTEKDIE